MTATRKRGVGAAERCAIAPLVLIPLLAACAVAMPAPAAATVAPPESEMRKTNEAYRSDPRPKQYHALLQRAVPLLKTDPAAAAAEVLFKKAITLQSGVVDPFHAKIGLTQAYLSQKKYLQAVRQFVTLQLDQKKGAGQRWLGELPALQAKHYAHFC